MRTITRLTLVFAIMLAAQSARADSDAVLDMHLTSTINYRFVGHLGQTDEAGRLLVWEAKAEGDINGTLKWWFVNPPPTSEVSYRGGRLTFYVARWELWDESELLLAGESAGKTDFRDGADGIWDGDGRVTETGEGYGHLKGRLIHETGPVVLGLDPPKSYSGKGVFQVY